MLNRRLQLPACAVALLFVSMAWGQSPPTEDDCSPHEKTLELRTAKAGLYYDLVGRALARSFDKQKPADARKLHAVCGRGSAENIQKLAENTIPFAIVQSDVAHAAWYGHPRLETCSGHDHTNESASSELVCKLSEPGCARRTARPVVITPLYIEAMHVLIRPHLNISTLGDLSGREVWAGSSGSGTRFAAERVLSAAGVQFCSVRFLEHNAAGADISQEEALRRLGEMQIDAVLFTGPVPTHLLEDALDEFPEIHFFALPYDLVQKLTQDESYTETLIRGKDYGKPDSTLTVGVEALLMTNEKVDRKDVFPLAEFIHTHSEDLRLALRSILESQTASEHNAEIASLAAHPAILLHRLKRWHDFKGKSGILKKVEAAVELSAENERVELTYDEQEALRDYLEGEEAHDAVARLPLLSLPTPDALVPDFYSADPAVRQYFSRPRSAAWKRQLAIAVAACLLLVLGLFVWMRRKLHRVLVNQPDAVLVTIAALLLWTFGSYFLYHYEGLVNEDFDPLWKSFGTIFLYFIPYLGKTALTPSGQRTIQILRALGVVVLGGFLSPLIRKIIAADLLAPLVAWLQGRPIMQSDIAGHLVIVNWDHRGRDIVRHLRATQAGVKQPVVVLTQSRADFPEEDCLGEIIGVAGDATQEQCLEKARIAFAHSVIVLSAWKPFDPKERRQSMDRDVADTKTIQTLRAIRDLTARLAPRPRLALTAEIRSSANKQEAERAAGDELQVEVVCVDALGNDVLVQAALNPGVATLYARLMNAASSSDASATGMFRTVVPRELLGGSFGEMLAYFAQRRGQGAASIPVAVSRGSQIFVNPSDTKLGRLQEGDVVFLIADHRPLQAETEPAAARASVA